MKRNFPYLDKEQFFRFPPVEQASPEGIVASGGNLSPGMLLSAYRQGIFPWFGPGEPVLWWSPDPRFLLFPEELHISRSMKTTMERGTFSFSFDTSFFEVIAQCSHVPRKGQNGETWITESMIQGYAALHELGYAHSLEVWQGGELCGGLYGISLGRCFFGESMFSRVSNASKAALIFLRDQVQQHNFLFIDCQVYTPHLASMGARNVPREHFFTLLDEGLSFPDMQGTWNNGTLASC